MNESAEKRISYKPRNLLRVNFDILEAKDFIPEHLAAFINLSEKEILNRIEYLHNRTLTDVERRQGKPPTSRPTILIARLALADEVRRIFTLGGFNAQKKIYKEDSDLNDSAQAYWNEVRESTGFGPEIHIRGTRGVEGTGGIWLALNDTPPPSLANPNQN